MSQTRRLAAILAADVAGYSRLMGADEEGRLERVKALRRELLDPKIAEHKGRILGSSPGTRPPATACWWNLPASSMRCAARSRCGTPPSATTANKKSKANITFLSIPYREPWLLFGIQK